MTSSERELYFAQFYSTRWNFQLMAANGYIVIAPNRRGMPGHGVEWNEQQTPLLKQM